LIVYEFNQKLLGLQEHTFIASINKDRVARTSYLPRMPAGILCMKIDGPSSALKEVTQSAAAAETNGYSDFNMLLVRR
jgi:hypothetical protein